MTTMICLERPSNASAEPSPAVSLRGWLGGCWAILFSHPGDFDQEPLERDRWLSVVSRSFDDHSVKPLALARTRPEGLEDPLGWLAELGDGGAALLATHPPADGALLDFRASALRAQIARSGPRFAMIIDPDLHCRRTVRYRVALDAPSPIELVGWAVALRERQGPMSSCSDAVTACIGWHAVPPFIDSARSPFPRAL